MIKKETQKGRNLFYYITKLIKKDKRDTVGNNRYHCTIDLRTRLI